MVAAKPSQSWAAMHLKYRSITSAPISLTLPPHRSSRLTQPTVDWRGLTQLLIPVVRTMRVAARRWLRCPDAERDVRVGAKGRVRIRSTDGLVLLVDDAGSPRGKCPGSGGRGGGRQP